MFNTYGSISDKLNEACEAALKLPEGDLRDAAFEAAAEESYEATRELEADLHFESTYMGLAA